MHQTRGMNHLRDFRKTSVALGHFLVRHRCPRDQQHDRRTHPLSPGPKQTLGCCVENRMLGTDQLLKVLGHDREIGVYRRKKGYH